MKARLSFFGALLGVLLAFADEAKPVKVKAWTLGFAGADALVEQVRGMVSPQGKVSYVPAIHKLIVVDIQEKLDLIDKIVRETAGPTRNIQIRVQFNEAGIAHHDGLMVTPKGSGGVSRTTGFGQNTAQMLTAMDGGRAYLEITREYPRPYLSYFYDYVRQFGVAMIHVEWRSVGSRLAIHPRSMGNLVRVRLIPELTYVTSAGPGAVAVERLATEVVLGNGQTIQIGSLSQDQEFSSRFFMGFDERGRSRSVSVTLTPTIMEIGPPPTGLKP